MAITNLDVIVSNPADRRRKEKLTFLIDTGATYSVVPSPVLKDLGIKPDEEREFTLADGKKISRKLGGARFEYNGSKGHEAMRKLLALRLWRQWVLPLIL